jgi:hypothetical protein
MCGCLLDFVLFVCLGGATVWGWSQWMGPTPAYGAVFRWWVLASSAMELPIMVEQPFHLGLESLEPYWCLLDHFVGFRDGVWGWISVVGTLHHLEQSLEGGGGGGPPAPNGFLMVGQPSTWVWSHWNHGACWITLCVLCAVVVWGWIWW